MTLQRLHIVYNTDNTDNTYYKYNGKHTNTLTTKIHSYYHNAKIIKINTNFYKFIYLYQKHTIQNAYIAIHNIDIHSIHFITKWHNKLSSYASNITLLLYNNNTTNLQILHLIIQFSSLHHIKIIHL